MPKDMKSFADETKAVHDISLDGFNLPDVVWPIHMSSTFKLESSEHGAGIFDGTSDGYVYTRIANPTINVLEKKIALLEGAEEGLATSSGMSAIASTAISFAKPGNNFIACNSIYGGTFALFNKHLRDLGIIPKFLSPSDSNDLQNIEKKIDSKTAFLFMETPANPTLDLIDIELWASVAKKYNIPLIVDNTFASPYLQKPLSHGADIVVHSATKYLGGHSDLLGGLIVSDKKKIDYIKEEYTMHYGPTLSPFNAWLILRGIRTLALRMEKHSDSALKIAHWLCSHKKVNNVYYPGLTFHPGYNIAKKQMKKFSGMLAFEVTGGIQSGKIIMNNVKLCTLAVSLGACETLIQHPASMTHSTYTKEQRAKAGITDGLIRLSVGIESSDDIIKDLDNALSLI